MKWRPEGWENRPYEVGKDNMAYRDAFEAGANALLEALKKEGSLIEATTKWALVIRAGEEHEETLNIYSPSNLERWCGRKGHVLFIPEEKP